MTVFLYRPSPQIPNPSLNAAQTCFDASTFNVRMHRNQIATKSVDLTWIFTQSLFMALNTILWTLSFSEIRAAHSKEIVENHLKQAQECIVAASERWPGVEAAMELYASLIGACLRVYDNGDPITNTFDLVSNGSSPMPSEQENSLLSTPSPSTIVSSLNSPQTSNNVPSPSPSVANALPNESVQQSSHNPKPKSYLTAPPPNTSAAASHKATSTFTTAQLKLPSQRWVPSQSYSISGSPGIMAQGYDQFFTTMGDPYFQYQQMPYIQQHPMESLNHEQQNELMRTLESDSGRHLLGLP